MVQILQLKHPITQSHIQAKFFTIESSVASNLLLVERKHQLSKVCKENEDQQENKKIYGGFSTWEETYGTQRQVLSKPERTDAV